MRTRWFCVALGTVLTTGVVASGIQDLPKPLWDIGGSGLFDRTDKAYAIDANGVVVADLRQGGRVCPTGLGHLVSGRSSVKEIRLVFDCPAAGGYWLHVHWDPGGSGQEQFAVLQGDQDVGVGSLVDGGVWPNADVRRPVPYPVAGGGVPPLAGPPVRRRAALQKSGPERLAADPAAGQPAVGVPDTGRLREGDRPERRNAGQPHGAPVRPQVAPEGSGGHLRLPGEGLRRPARNRGH